MDSQQWQIVIFSGIALPPLTENTPLNFFHTKRQGVKKIRLRDTTPKPITDKIYHVMFYNDPKSDVQIALALRWKEMKFVNWCPWYKTRNMGWKTFQVAIQSWRQQFRGQLFVIVAVSPQRRQVRERQGEGHSFAGIIIFVYSDAACGDDDNNCPESCRLGGRRGWLISQLRSKWVMIAQVIWLLVSWI